LRLIPDLEASVLYGVAVADHILHRVREKGRFWATAEVKNESLLAPGS
jgi:hypothetical protein